MGRLWQKATLAAWANGAGGNSETYDTHPNFLRFALLKTTFEISYKVTTGTVFSVFGKAAGKTGSPQK